MPGATREAVDRVTTCRAALELETRPRDAEVALDYLVGIQVDAPNVNIAARLAVAHRIGRRLASPSAGASFGLA